MKKMEKEKNKYKMVPVFYAGRSSHSCHASHAG